MTEHVIPRVKPKKAAEPKEKRPTLNTGLWTTIAAEHDGPLYRLTKAMNCAGGVLVNVSTESSNRDGSKVLAESVTFVDNARLVSRNSTPFIEKH